MMHPLQNVQNVRRVQKSKRVQKSRFNFNIFTRFTRLCTR